LTFVSRFLCPEYIYRGNNLTAVSLIYFSLGQFETAVKYLDESTYLQENNLINRILYCCCQYYLGNEEKAVASSYGVKNAVTTIKQLETLVTDELLNKLKYALKHIGIEL
jgi:hypothetical protein